MKNTLLLLIAATSFLVGCDAQVPVPASENVVVLIDQHWKKVIDHTRAASYSVYADTDDVEKLKDPGFLEALRATPPSGSAFGVSMDGLVLTNMHVVQGTNFCTAPGNAEGDARQAKTSDTYCMLVTQSTSEVYRAKVLIIDEENDVVVMKIVGEYKNLPYLRLALPGSFSYGTHVLTIGNPIGQINMMTPGIISNLDYYTLDQTGDQTKVRKIQFSGSMLPGNSGGPLVSVATGEVVGQVVAIYMANGVPTQMSYANPVETLRKNLLAVPQE